jgi:hypothetical protein
MAKSKPTVYLPKDHPVAMKMKKGGRITLTKVADDADESGHAFEADEPTPGPTQPGVPAGTNSRRSKVNAIDYVKKASRARGTYPGQK